MPKHVPTFKHLLASPATPQKDKQPSTKSVNDLLATSRISQPQPEASLGLRPGETLWTPATTTIGPPDLYGGSVHPAEVARRREVERRRARRGVAGPAPPPSWAGSNAQATAPGTTTLDINGSHIVETRSSSNLESVSTTHLIQSASLFSDHRLDVSTSPRTLVECCLRNVLRYLNDHTIIGEALPDDDEVQPEPRGWTIGALLTEQVPYLDTHLKIQLLECHSLLPEGSPYRLTDQNIMTVISASLEEDQDGTMDMITEELNEEANDDNAAHIATDTVDPGDESERSTDWDQPTTSTSIRHLPLTLHPSPISILRRINTLHSVPLTSLNLAYSTIPDLKRLVGVLPVGLRELGLCGIRIGRGEQKQQAIESWRRGLSALGRKMIVLKMLDLSESPYPIIQQYLTALLFPSSRLPSLRLLSLRGSVNTEFVSMAGSPPRQTGPRSKQDTIRSDLLEVIRGRSKERYLEVVWS